MKDVAAHNLEGKILSTGWKVLKKKTKTAASTGGNFSVCYDVEKDGKICFMKAIDFTCHLANNFARRSVVDLMTDMLKQFQYERDLSIYCQDNRVTKVAFVIESGEESVTGFTYGIVPYLIFEMADGDVRTFLAYSAELDFAWKLKSLRDIAVGLRQLHGIGVAHQDLKPSNVLLFHDESKIGDLGRSMCPALNGPYDDLEYSGDFTYAPPEVLYRFHIGDWEQRTYLSDCYLLGSLVVFYTTGVSMNALIMNHLSVSLQPVHYRGSFEEVETYLLNAFQKALIDIGNSVPFEVIKDRLVKLIEYLCYPTPAKRGHPKNISSIGSNYDLTRFVSELDYLRLKSEQKLLKH